MRGFIGLNTTAAIRKQNQVLWISNKVWQQNMWLLIEFNHIRNYKYYQHSDFVSKYELRYIVQATHESFTIQGFYSIKIYLC